MPVTQLDPLAANWLDRTNDLDTADLASRWAGVKSFVVALALAAAVLGATSTSLADDEPSGAVGSTGAASSSSAASTHYGFLSRQVNPKAPIARWNPCVAIGFRVNPTGGGTGATADVIEAARRVRAATGLPLVYRGKTTVVPGKGTATYPKDTQIVVAWTKVGTSRFLPRPSKGKYAVAGYGGGAWTTGWDAKGRQWGRFLQGYVVLNSGYHFAHGFGTGPSTGWQGTRGQLVMHELGHAVGLDHTTDRNQIMYPTMTRKKAVFRARRQTGLHYLGEPAAACTPASAEPGSDRGRFPPDLAQEQQPEHRQHQRHEAVARAEVATVASGKSSGRSTLKRPDDQDAHELDGARDGRHPHRRPAAARQRHRSVSTNVASSRRRARRGGAPLLDARRPRCRPS